MACLERNPDVIWCYEDGYVSNPWSFAHASDSEHGVCCHFGNANLRLINQRLFTRGSLDEKAHQKVKCLSIQHQHLTVIPKASHAYGQKLTKIRSLIYNHPNLSNEQLSLKTKSKNDKIHSLKLTYWSPWKIGLGHPKRKLYSIYSKPSISWLSFSGRVVMSTNPILGSLRGEAIYAALFDAAPSLQSLFKTPRPLGFWWRRIEGNLWFVDKLQKSHFWIFFFCFH